MPKKIKQKQKQKQKQSVIVNVNLAKPSRKSSNKQINKSNKQNLPPPVHKIYTSPIHDLSPQMFSGGKQITQPSLAEQINAYLSTMEQGRIKNVLGETPSQNVNLSQFTAPKRPLPRMPLRQNINLDAETDTDVDPPLNVNPLGAKKKGGRTKGSKNKPKIQATEVLNSVDVLGIAERIAEPEYDETKQIPDEYMREQFLLRQPQNNPDEPPSIFTSPRPVDQPLSSYYEKEKGKQKLFFDYNI